MAIAWQKVNTVVLLLVLFALVTLIGMVAMRAEGGDLEPPDAPAPTDAVHLPGTPISGSTVIAEPGHYYLTRNIVVGPGQTAILISVSNVSLDLGGFTILGSGFDGTGIATDFVDHVQIRNGSVMAFGIGIDTSQSSYVFIDGVLADRNVTRGIELGPSSVLSNCGVFNGDGEGIVAEGAHATIKGCTVTGNDLNGISLVSSRNLVEDSAIYGNSEDNLSNTGGIRVSGNANVIRDNNLSETTGGAAIYITGTGNAVVDNASSCGTSTSGITDLGSLNVYVAASDHENICLPVN